VLVHAARNAPEWLAVVAPDALELAVTLGNTRVLGREVGVDDDDDDDDDDGGGGGVGRTSKKDNENERKEAAVLSNALELALTVLDGCIEVDGGRSIGLDHTALVLGTGEWATMVFSHLEKGVRMPGGGGAQEVKLRRAAAGVLLKVDELTSRWRRSMVDIR
jgi:telomere length regulation protein